MRADKTLEDRVVFLTGGSRGIGQATARIMTEQGARVIEFSRSGGDGSGSEVSIRADVSDWDSISSAATRAIDDFGPVDVLINNAGVRGSRGPIWDLNVEDYAHTLSTNVLGPFYMMKLLLPQMAERRAGVVVNISSGAARRPKPRRAMYGSSKAALDHLTLASAAEAAEFGVRMHAFYPGPVDTDMFNSSRRDPQNTEEEKAALEARIAAGEMQPATEPAAAIAWLASPAGAGFQDVIVQWGDIEQRALIRKLAGL